MNKTYSDSGLSVQTIAKTERPNLVVYLAMHQDYSYSPTIDEYDEFSQLSDPELGERIVKNCIKFGHWGILEHPQITVNVIGFPHSVMVQARTHRHLTFDVSSQRYCGQQILELVESWITNNDPMSIKIEDVDEFFYFRPEGRYNDRHGNNYIYSIDQIVAQKRKTVLACEDYYCNVKKYGLAPEHARDFLPQNIRQPFVMSGNARAILHFLDLRLPKDAQLEIRIMAEMLLKCFMDWMPEVGHWYVAKRAGKNLLSP